MAEREAAVAVVRVPRRAMMMAAAMMMMMVLMMAGAVCCAAKPHATREASQDNSDQGQRQRHRPGLRNTAQKREGIVAEGERAEAGSGVE